MTGANLPLNEREDRTMTVPVPTEMSPIQKIQPEPSCQPGGMQGRSPPDSASQSLAHLIELLLGHVGEERQSQGSPSDSLGHRKIAGPEAGEHNLPTQQS